MQDAARLVKCVSLIVRCLLCIRSAGHPKDFTDKGAKEMKKKYGFESEEALSDAFVPRAMREKDVDTDMGMGMQMYDKGCTEHTHISTLKFTKL